MKFLLLFASSFLCNWFFFMPRSSLTVAGTRLTVGRLWTVDYGLWRRAVSVYTGRCIGREAEREIVSWRERETREDIDMISQSRNPVAMTP